ncbi:hypothetical protein Poli38472_008453 [Pythium oligandrum]|uniref:Uncharacterized protein n=1 Tax=Pythium oligandrum TaxID=41045 RepID=A0A8K1C3L8_PYTOL|nr:hypothetical protein Poli38472_008453 [Pythium oligandrum]|eukprot:TMW55805.1 hypothetical protein Poli38472_008453 [Pythium oligandrum]
MYAFPAHSHSVAIAMDAVVATHRRMRRRPGETAGDTETMDATAASGSKALDPAQEDDVDAYTAQQLVSIRTSGWLALSLYTVLALAILWMTMQHFRHNSSRRKKVFHIILFFSIGFNLPDPLGWLLWPETESWVYTYPMRIYAVLLQSVCKSMISILWSEVVSAGQSYERRRTTTYVSVFNGILLVWAIAVPILLMQYENNLDGQYAFMDSSLRGVVTYSGVAVIFIYGLLLSYQGLRLRRRLLLARGTVPVGSVEKSLSQLLLTVCVIVFSDLLRIVSLILNELDVRMSMVSFLVCNNLIPTIFPTICMMYLMRRYTKQPDQQHDPLATTRGAPFTSVSVKPERGRTATLSRYMSDEHRGSDLSDSSTPVLGMSKYALPTTQAGHVDPQDYEAGHGHPVIMADSSTSQHAMLTPTSYWARGY